MRAMGSSKARRQGKGRHEQSLRLRGGLQQGNELFLCTARQLQSFDLGNGSLRGFPCGSHDEIANTATLHFRDTAYHL
jgi:hypothetical protein